MSSPLSSSDPSSCSGARSAAPSAYLRSVKRISASPSTASRLDGSTRRISRYSVSASLVRRASHEEPGARDARVHEIGIDLERFPERLERAVGFAGVGVEEPELVENVEIRVGEPARLGEDPARLFRPIELEIHLRDEFENLKRGDFGVVPKLHEKRERRFLVSETVFDLRENGARVAAVPFPRHEILAVFLRRFEIADPESDFREPHENTGVSRLARRGVQVILIRVGEIVLGFEIDAFEIGDERVCVVSLPRMDAAGHEDASPGGESDEKTFSHEAFLSSTHQLYRSARTRANDIAARPAEAPGTARSGSRLNRVFS